MRSIHADYFNHDEDADGYDDDVADETDPIRAGYGRLQNWIAGNLPTGCTEIVDLGCGTGNTTLACLQRNPSIEKITAVDVSEKMQAIAGKKLTEFQDLAVRYVQDDLLSFSSAASKLPQAVVSCYAIHHLTASEKEKLLELVVERLPAGGRFIIGDLMFRDSGYEEAMRRKYPGLVEDFDDEFFWNLADSLDLLASLPVASISESFSDLSYGLSITKLG